MKNSNHHKEEIIAKLKNKLAKVESDELAASTEPDTDGQCPIGYLYNADCACCLLDVGK